jgi:OFA family oxalate/formate antiporter-like MFS transporter
MTDKVINRWFIVLGAIMIQLSLGAIYAWSVFTPPLSSPLPDDDFQQIMVDDGLTIVTEGDLKVGKAVNISLSFIHDGINVTDMKNITVSVELRDKSNAPVEDDKVIQFIGVVYKEGKPVKAGPYTPKPAGDHYYITSKVSKPGNWHFVITGDRWEGGNLTEYQFEVLQKVKTGEYGFSISQTQLIFAVGLLTFAIFTIIGGRLSAKFGPRKMAIAGGITLGFGYILGSFMGSNLFGLIFCIGILGGAGIGLAYVVPIAVGVKWFPDKKGLISGLAVAGFGFGALLWIKLCTGFVFGPLKLSGDWPGLFVYNGGTMTVSNVFLLYGIIFLVTVVLAGLIMRNPPEGWKPKGWNPPEQTAKATGKVEFTSAQMRKTPQYWMLFFMFMVGAGSGLMVIGVIQLFGKYALIKEGIPSDDAVIIAGTAFALFYSLANGFGRIIWGALSDKIGRKTAFISMFTLQGLMMIAFFFVGGSEYLLYLSAAVIGFNFGGNFALFPSATADFFGNKSVGLNYGWVFLSYGFGGIIGPMLGGIMGDMEYWMWAFIPAGVACLIAAGIALMLKPPKAP